MIKTATFLLHLGGEKEKTSSSIYLGKSAKESYKYRCLGISKSWNMKIFWQTVSSFELLKKPKNNNNKKKQNQLVFTEQNLRVLFILSEL